MGNRHAEAELAHLLWDALRRHDARVIAQRLGLSTSSVYKASEGEQAIPAWWLPGIFAATGDVALFAAMTGAGEVGLVVSRELAPSAKPETLEREALDLASEAGAAVKLVRDATADGIITPTEAEQLRLQVDKLERCAEEIKQLLKAVAA